MTGAASTIQDDVILAAVINWNGWQDTLSCAQSLQAMDGPPFHLLLCDNGSTDGSYERLCAWASKVSVGSGGNTCELGAGACVASFGRPAGPQGVLQCIHVMRLPRNLGYAGAINRCIEWGAQAIGPECYWLLNNDIWLDPAALGQLVEAVGSAPNIGLCGSVLLEWDPPHQVQAVGGRFDRWLAVGRHIKRLPAHAGPGPALFFDIDYPVGASMLVTREFVRIVGLMDEGYFLYYEEVDWALRGRACGFQPAVALCSEVRHKEGASTGSMGGVRRKSMLSEYYGVVNRLRITRKFTPWLLPLVWASLALVALDRVAHGEWARASLVLRLMLRPGSVPRP